MTFRVPRRSFSNLKTPSFVHDGHWGTCSSGSSKLGMFEGDLELLELELYLGNPIFNFISSVEVR
jgi:hypothetical protein